MDSRQRIDGNGSQYNNLDSTEDLFQLICISRIRYSELFQYDVFQNIYRVAKQKNKAKKITAVLCFSDGYFMQYAEGSEQALTNLKNKLLKDKRHHSFQLCDFKEINSRRFPDIHQGFFVVDKRQQFSQSALQDYLPMTPYKWDLEKKIKLLDIIKSNDLVQEDFQLSNYDRLVMRAKLLFQLTAENFNYENRFFGLLVIFLLVCITVLILMVFTVIPIP